MPTHLKMGRIDASFPALFLGTPMAGWAYFVNVVTGGGNYS